MSEFSIESPNIYLLRRVAPHQIKNGILSPKVFALREGENGLSVFDARFVTPNSVLESYIDTLRNNLLSEDDKMRENAQRNLAECSDVETMLEKGWRVIKNS